MIAALGRDALVFLCASATAFYVLAWFSARRFFSRTAAGPGAFEPPVTILKPLRGLDPDAYENFASFCRQDYRRYQVIFGADSAEEPALPTVWRLTRDFPDVDLRVVITPPTGAANPKVGNLAGMVAEAKHPFLLVSDSDIHVGPTHLREMVRPLEDPQVGVVTCLYRSRATSFAGTLDALGLSTEFQPSVLVARQVQGIRFAMGSGILIRRAVLDEIGGFEAIADYLADDYLLGHLSARAGHRVELSRYVVEHRLQTSTLGELVQHQLRWNQGIRAGRPWGYAGLVLTQGVTASVLLVTLAAGWPLAWAVAGITLAARLGMAWYIAVRCLRDSVARRALWLVPARDLLGFALWAAAFLRTTIVWRGSRLRLGKGGRLLPAGTAASVSSEEGPARVTAVS